ncbi:flagellar motor protein MotB [Oceanobacter mangrovi]|uniref:flagellar motor protein MotB n=1 Tax=Oceanobacter mangrovi TaxID=2862510 RepID=UPI001C8DADA1|nr:flagellar motor protein MotB [Oceanobacter mangrovi]
MENLGQQPPIIIRRGGRHRHEDHGGAWKVAMADFALAMMALFLVLWIISNSTEDQRKAISGYFHDPKAFAEGKLAPSASAIDLGGSPSPLANIGQDGASDPIVNLQPQPSSSDGQQQDQLENLEEQFKEMVLDSPTLSPFKDQIKLDITTDGLRLQIVDKQDRPMFDLGSSRLNYYVEDILWELAPVLANSGLKMSVTGHTDANSNSGTGRAEDNRNWILSAMRADSARRALVEAGVADGQISQVIGMGDSAPYDRQDPTAAVNRRIGLLLLSPRRERELEQQTGPVDPAAKVDQKGMGATASPASSSIQSVQKNRNRADNQYDNPPNLLE